MNDERVSMLHTVYALFFEKSQELLRFFYWTDEFYKGARGQIGNYAGQLASANEKGDARWRELSAKGAWRGATLQEMRAASDRVVKRWQGVASHLEAVRKELLCRVALVYIVGLFEAFFADSAAVLLTAKQSDKMASVGFSKQVRYLEKNLRVSVDAWAVNLRLCDVDEVFARRNLLLHCGGIVDERYLKRVGSSTFSAGDEASVDEHYFLRAAYAFQSLAGYLLRVLVARSKELDKEPGGDDR